MKSLTTTAKQFTLISLLILMVPFLFFAGMLVQQLFSISLLPEGLLSSSLLLRIIVFAVIIIMLPLAALILNVVSLNRLRNVEGQEAMRLTNYIIIVVTGSVAILFTIVMLTD